MALFRLVELLFELRLFVLVYSLALTIFDLVLYENSKHEHRRVETNWCLTRTTSEHPRSISSVCPGHHKNAQHGPNKVLRIDLKFDLGKNEKIMTR